MNRLEHDVKLLLFDGRYGERRVDKRGAVSDPDTGLKIPMARARKFIQPDDGIAGYDADGTRIVPPLTDAEKEGQS